VLVGSLGILLLQGCEAQRVSSTEMSTVASDDCTAVNDCHVKYGDNDRLVCLGGDCFVIAEPGETGASLPALPGQAEGADKTYAGVIYPSDRKTCWGRGGAWLVQMDAICDGCDGILSGWCVGSASRCERFYGEEACEIAPAGWQTDGYGDAGTMVLGSESCDVDLGPEAPESPCGM